MGFGFGKKRETAPKTQENPVMPSPVRRDISTEELRVQNLRDIGQLALDEIYGEDSAMIYSLATHNLAEIGSEHNWPKEELMAGRPVQWLEKHAS